jgi:hypothetical protein
MKLNYSKKILIIAVVTFLVVIILNIIFTNLLMNKIVNINTKVEQLDISSQEREKALDQRDSVLGSVSDREELDKYFVGAGNIETVNFTKYLEDLSFTMGVVQRKTLDYEAIPEMTDSSIVSVIRYKFNISGKWSNVYNFLQAIETLPKVAHLNGTSLNYDNINKNWSADIDFSVIKLK